MFLLLVQEPVQLAKNLLARILYVERAAPKNLTFLYLWWPCPRIQFFRKAIAPWIQKNTLSPGSHLYDVGNRADPGCVYRTTLQSHGVHAICSRCQCYFNNPPPPPCIAKRSAIAKIRCLRFMHHFCVDLDAISVIENVWLKSHRTDITCDVHSNAV